MLLVGIDLVDVEEVERSVARLGDRYKKRLFSERELASCQGSVSTSALLAEHLAAKEAVIKVLRPGGHGLDWRSIEVRRGKTGRCTLHLSGEASELARGAGIVNIEISLSRGAGQAIALAVASLGPSPSGGVASGVAER
jgi:holo-[acyl-carrier protein] synthase